MVNILVTGGAGYIGSHAAINLLDAGYSVTIIDNLSTGHFQLIPKKAEFIKCNINNTKKLDLLFKRKKFTALMHFAGFVEVEESVNFPKKYFINNTKNSQKLFKTCIKNNLKNIVFSSTAAVYGNTKKEFITPSALNPDFHSPYSTVSATIDHTATPAIPKPIKLGKPTRANNQKFS